MALETLPLVWDLLDIEGLLTLERLDDDLFRNAYNQRNVNGALYGGQVFGQALAAATLTVPANRLIRSCHGYFLRAGRNDQRLIFKVEHALDGGSFSNRRVVAMQGSKTMLYLQCSFHVQEQGFEHQPSMPEVAGPEGLESLKSIINNGGPDVPEIVADSFSGLHPIELRPLDRATMFEPLPAARRQCWMRMEGAAGVSSQAMQRTMLSYMSDFWLSGVSLQPHVVPYPTPDIFLTSLDHTIWFHRDVRVDEWLLYDTDSPSASNGTGLARGLIYDRQGRLVAATMQEALMRSKRQG